MHVQTIQRNEIRRKLRLGALALITTSALVTGLALTAAAATAVQAARVTAQSAQNTAAEVAAAIAALDRGDFLNYTDPVYLSGIDYPASFTLFRVDLENGDSQAMFRKENIAVQLTLGPDSEGRSLSVENITAANPGLKMSNAHEIVIGDHTPALVFDAQDGGHKTLEVWFTQNDLLYQATTGPESAPLLLRMLQTFAVNWPK